jgi:sulfatase modifying factor 1
MNYVPGGTFPTGDHDNGAQQTVSTGFWMGETEVTYELWSKVYVWATGDTNMNGIIDNGEAAGNYKIFHPGVLGSGGSGSVQQPVTTISWRDAMVWCNATSELAGLTPVYYTDEARTTWITNDDGGNIDTTAGHEDNPYIKDNANGFRLPGSWEWECAARYIGTTNPGWGIFDNNIYWTPGFYASGATADITNKAANDQVAVYGLYYDGSTSQWLPTGVTSTDVVKSSRTPNNLGIYDMSGNVYEWCFDWAGINSTLRVRRGGSWYDPSFGLEIGYVNTASPYEADNWIGFRLARNK